MRILIPRSEEDKWSVRRSNGFPVWSDLRLGCRIMLIRRFKFRLDIDVCLLSRFLACYFSTSRPHTSSPADLSFSSRVAFDTSKLKRTSWRDSFKHSSYNFLFEIPCIQTIVYLPPRRRCQRWLKEKTRDFFFSSVNFISYHLSSNFFEQRRSRIRVSEFSMRNFFLSLSHAKFARSNS